MFIGGVTFQDHATPFLKHRMLQWGGVLLLLYHISYIVTYCVYPYTMSHPLTSMISDARGGYDSYVTQIII